jgi:hypothetical protein
MSFNSDSRYQNLSFAQADAMCFQLAVDRGWASTSPSSMSPPFWARLVQNPADQTTLKNRVTYLVTGPGNVDASMQADIRLLALRDYCGV